MLLLLLALSEDVREDINRCIREIAKGDAGALETLYSAVGGRLLSVAVGLMRNKESAEDVLQESLIKIVRGAPSFHGGNGYGWACKIVRNTALNWIKSEKLRRAENLDSIYNLSDGKDFFGESVAAADIYNALKTLDSRERHLIWLRYYNDMTIREIAADTGIKKTTVQDILTRAEKKLRELLI